MAPRSAGGYQRVAFLSELGANSATTLAFGPYQGTLALYYTTYGGGGQVRRVTYSGANTAPVAAFSSATGGAGGLTATLNGGASYDPDSGDSVVQWSWDFGDGATAVTTGPTTSHTYAAAGSYPVRLVVKDRHRARSSATPASRSTTPPARRCRFTTPTATANTSPGRPR